MVQLVFKTSSRRITPSVVGSIPTLSAKEFNIILSWKRGGAGASIG